MENGALPACEAGAKDTMRLS